MPCIPFNDGKGSRGFLCTSRRRPPRCKCGSGLSADLLCDWKVDTKPEVKTCDRKICPACTHKPAPGKDLCPEHAAAWLARAARSASGSPTP